MHMHGVEKRENGENIPTKKALTEMVKANPDSVTVYDTSAFDPDPNYTAKDMPMDEVFYIVGPDPYKDRKWYAQIKRTDKGTTVK